MSAFYDAIKTRKAPYIIAEIGANHNGDMALAKKTIDAAGECGCDAVKFQSWDTESLISKDGYGVDQPSKGLPKNKTASLRDMVKKYYLRPEQHFELKKYCDQVGITFASTPFSIKEVDLLNECGVKFFKVASMDVNNLDLLTHIAGKQKPVVLATGMATFFEIKQAVNTIEAAGNKEIVLLHCVSLYPPEDEDVNLNNILMLRESFSYPVGFSDHTIGCSIPLASVALGACLIEKHFTLDKSLPGWDHEVSADPVEMKIIVNESKKVAAVLGSHDRIVSEREEEKKSNFRRSLVLNKNLKKGSIISEVDLNAKRPGVGIPPDNKKSVLGRKLIRNMSCDEILRWEDLS